MMLIDSLPESFITDSSETEIDVVFVFKLSGILFDLKISRRTEGETEISHTNTHHFFYFTSFSLLKTQQMFPENTFEVLLGPFRMTARVAPLEKQPFLIKRAFQMKG